MRLLLDTHVMLWWLRDNPKLGSRSKALIADPRAELMVSIASFWEFSIKSRVGKFPERGSALLHEAEEGNIEIVSVRQAHLRALESLEVRSDHKDPFDHLILAQAVAESAMLVTSDRKMRGYGVPCFP